MTMDRGGFSQVAVGTPIYTEDNEFLGEVKEVQGTAFMVDAPMQRDYWLRLDAVRSTTGGQIVIGANRDSLDGLKLSGPDEVNTDAGRMTDYRASDADTLAGASQTHVGQIRDTGATGMNEPAGTADMDADARAASDAVASTRMDAATGTMPATETPAAYQPAGQALRNAEDVNRNTGTIGAYDAETTETTSPGYRMQPNTTAGAYDAGRTADFAAEQTADGDTAGRMADQGDRGRVVLHDEELRARKTPMEAGEAVIRKDVVSEEQTVEVPVRREEVYIERHPASGERADGEIGEGGEIRVPVMEERAELEKRTVAREEVGIGKRAVEDTEHLSGTVRHEEARIETEGDVNVRGAAAPGSNPGDRMRDDLHRDGPTRRP